MHGCRAHHVCVRHKYAHVCSFAQLQTQRQFAQLLRHKCEQKIVLNNILRELVDIVGVAKSNCVVISEETGLHSMEAKNTGVYIDAVKQIMSIYKQLEACNRNRTA